MYSVNAPPTLLDCAYERREIEAKRHVLARQALTLAAERHQHEQEYLNKEAAEALSNVQRELCEANVQNEKLKLEVLRWRKQSSLLRLKLASAKEDVQLHERNISLLCTREERLSKEVAALTAQLTAAAQQITDAVAAKALAQAEWAKCQGQALQAEMQLTKTTEELKLANGRSSAAASQAAELLQQLQAAQAENASLQAQLAHCEGRDAEAAAAHKQLQQTLELLQGNLRGYQEQLSHQEHGRLKAEAAAAKANAAAEAAAEKLAVKEQQLAEWRELEQKSKEVTSQQLQLSQAQLEDMRGKATTNEAKLLDQVAALQQQCAAERAARSAAAAEQESAAATCEAAGAALEGQVTALKQQVALLESELQVAVDTAKLESERAAALEEQLEQQSEQHILAAVQAVGDIVQQLPEDDEADGIKSINRPNRRRGRAAAGRAAAIIREQQLLLQEPEGRSEDGSAPQDLVLRAMAAGNTDGARSRGGKKQQGTAKDQAKVAKQQQEQSKSTPRKQVLQQAADNQQQIDRPSCAAGNKGSQHPMEWEGNTGAAAADVQLQHAANHAAACSSQPVQPPALSFVPDSFVAPPSAVLAQPGVGEAVMARRSAADMLKKIATGLPGHADKPGARKRNLGAFGQAGSAADVIPRNMLVKPSFQAPKVRKPTGELQ